MNEFNIILNALSFPWCDVVNLSDRATGYDVNYDFFILLTTLQFVAINIFLRNSSAYYFQI